MSRRDAPSADREAPAEECPRQDPWKLLSLAPPPALELVAPRLRCELCAAPLLRLFVLHSTVGRSKRRGGVQLWRTTVRPWEEPKAMAAGSPDLLTKNFGCGRYRPEGHCLQKRAANLVAE
jgi:hypothetical protein